MLRLNMFHCIQTMGLNKVNAFKVTSGPECLKNELNTLSCQGLNPTVLRKAKYNFGLSECNRVKKISMIKIFSSKKKLRTFSIKSS